METVLAEEATVHARIRWYTESCMPLWFPAALSPTPRWHPTLPTLEVVNSTYRMEWTTTASNGVFHHR